MANRKNANLALVETPVEETTVVAAPETDLPTLLAQQKTLQEQIKAAKAAMPKRDKLAELIHRQNASCDQYIQRWVANRIKARVALGQDRQEAGDQVIALVLNLAQERIDHEEMDEQQARAQEVVEENGEATND